MKKKAVAAQLWPVREECEKDFAGTIQQISAMGYEGIEFAGFPKIPASQIKKILQEHRLLCAGAHISIDELKENTFSRTVDWCATVGVSIIIVPGLPKELRSTVSAIKRTAEEFNKLVEHLKSSKIRIGFHNHAVDLEMIEGKTMLEHFFLNTSSEVLLQLDTGHIARAGYNPVDLLKHYGKRVVTVHLKEWTPEPQGAVIGEGKVEWQKVFKVCEEINVQWYIIEQEISPLPPLETARRCRENIKKMEV